MRFHVRSYRNGIQILRACPAFQEVTKVLADLSLEEVRGLRAKLQENYDKKARDKGGEPRKAGVQTGLNALLKDRLVKVDWSHQVSVFAPDANTEKGLWTMDFAKSYDTYDGARMSVGLEVTFNHGEALTWTPLRLTLAHEAEDVKEDARINVGCIVIGTDQLKGRGGELRMDSAVGTFERLVTLLPKMRPVLPAPLVIFGLDWADGGMHGRPLEIDLHTSKVASRPAIIRV